MSWHNPELNGKFSKQVKAATFKIPTLYQPSEWCKNGGSSGVKVFPKDI